MGVLAILRTERGEQLRALDDPNGGSFDAAGDFDGLLGRVDDSYRLLKYVDPYGDTIFNNMQMPDLLSDIERLSQMGVAPVERRGLSRLRALAELCREGVHLYVWFIGD
jgi:hypothetical protein